MKWIVLLVLLLPIPGFAQVATSVQGVAPFQWNGTNWVNTTTALKPGGYTLVPLDVATVTTGATAVAALTAGHRSAGGWLQNPSTATVSLCINEIGTASGVTSAGSTTCIVPGQTYTLTPAAGAVSVITSDSAHAFAGLGLQ